VRTLVLVENSIYSHRPR